jgi:hypothetical protein
MQIARYEGSLASISEEYMEAFAGQVKKHIQDRGAHNPYDLVRQVQASDSAAEAKADAALRTRKPSCASRAEQMNDPSYALGLAICGSALQLDGVRAAFKQARQRLPADLQGLFVDRGRALFVSSSPPAVGFEWHSLIASHNVLCFCDRACVHVKSD